MTPLSSDPIRPRHKRVRYPFVRVGHNADGWSAQKGRPTRSGSKSNALTGGTLWDVVKFFTVPRRYYLWQYKRRMRNV